MTAKYATYEDSVATLKRENRLRTLKPMIPINGAFILFEDQKMLSFCSHDYLGMADNPETKKNAIKFLLEHGVTASTESQDLYLNCQCKLEEKFSKILARESTLFFPSRYEANVATLSTLAHAGSHLFVDEAAHPSILAGAKQSAATVHTYPHERLDRLEQFLKNADTGTKILVIESVFSSTGAIANLPKLIEMAIVYDAILMVDDSHAFGVAGVEGMGFAANLREIDIITGSLSKTVGAYGGYMTSSKTLRDYLTSHSPIQTSFLFPPPIIGAIDGAIDLIPEMEGERKQLEQRSHWLRSALRPLGFDLPKANTPLISLLYNNAQEVEELRARLKKEQILVGPTRCFAKEGARPRLNLAINICHMPDHLERLVEIIR